MKEIKLNQRKSNQIKLYKNKQNRYLTYNEDLIY